MPYLLSQYTSHERMNEIAEGLMRAKAAGHCSHEKREEYEWLLEGGYEATVQATCTECDKTATWDELERDRNELIADWTGTEHSQLRYWIV